MVQKKYIKIGVVAISMVALAIGLGVGISQSQNKNSTTAASASIYSTYDGCDVPISTASEGGKSGKGPTSPSEGKSGKSGPTAPSEGKARKLRDEMLRGKSGLYIYVYLFDVTICWGRMLAEGGGGDGGGVLNDTVI